MRSCPFTKTAQKSVLLYIKILIAGIQISKPFDGAVPAFQNLLEKQKLDKWLTLFVASEDVQNVKAHAYFEYISDKNFSKDIYALSNEL